MFRKKRWFPRRSGTRTSKIPARKIPKSIARVRTDWVSVYNLTDTFDSTGCQYLVAPWLPVNVPGIGQQCFSTWSLTVMTSDQLSDLYGDDVKIVAMVGDIWMRPVFQTADACSYADLRRLQDDWADYFIRVRGGLFKQRVVSGSTNTDGVNAHPLYSRDWTDGGFLKTFERNWYAPPPKVYQATYNDGQVVGVCPNVHQAGYNVPVTASGDQDPYSVPALSTTCGVYQPSAEQCLDGAATTEYTGPGWKRVSISRRRDIHMHEDDAVAWYVDWARLTPAQSDCGYGTATNPCAMHIIPSLKLKLQYG